MMHSLVGEAKDKEIAGAKEEIQKRDTAIAQGIVAAKAEREKDAAKFQDEINKKEQALTDLKNEQIQHDRKIWINSIRAVCLILIVLGVLAIALTKGEMIIQGSIMAVSGVLGIFIAMGFDILTQQKWFPWAFGAVAFAALVGVGWWLYGMYRAHTLLSKATSAFDDIKTEAEATSSDLWKKVKEHTDYRGITDLLTQKATKLGLSVPAPK